VEGPARHSAGVPFSDLERDYLERVRPPRYLSDFSEPKNCESARMAWMARVGMFGKSARRSKYVGNGLNENYAFITTKLIWPYEKAFRKSRGSPGLMRKLNLPETLWPGAMFSYAFGSRTILPSTPPSPSIS
jgi:hypothetical protein